MRRRKDKRKPAPAEGPTKRYPDRYDDDFSVAWAEIANEALQQPQPPTIHEALARARKAQPQVPADAVKKDRGGTPRGGGQLRRKIVPAVVKKYPRPRPQPTRVLLARRDAPELPPSEASLVMIRERRAAGHSWKAISRELETRFGIARHPKTLQRWLNKRDK